MERLKFLNIKVDNLTMNEALSEIKTLVDRKQKSYVVTPNLDHIVQIETDNELSKAYENASLILTDGKPLIWISKYLKNPIKEKISGSDLFPNLCKLAADNSYSMFFLGGGSGVAEKAAENLKQKFPGLNVVGCYSPSFGFEKNEKEINKIINCVNEAKPDILIVALGCPKQEVFMYKFSRKLASCVSLGLGASLDFEAGNIKRAPRWMSNCGLEWLFRIFQEPKRMFKRYLNDFLKIFKIIKKYK